MGKLKVSGLHRCFGLREFDDFSDRFTELEFLKRDGLSCGYSGKWVDEWHTNDKDAATAVQRTYNCAYMCACIKCHYTMVHQQRVPCMLWCMCGQTVCLQRCLTDIGIIQHARWTNTCKLVNSGTPLCEQFKCWPHEEHTTRLTEWSHYCNVTSAIICIPTT